MAALWLSKLNFTKHLISVEIMFINRSVTEVLMSPSDGYFEHTATVKLTV